MGIVNDVRRLAYGKYGKIQKNGDFSDPISMLRNVQWKIPQGESISNEVMGKWNLELDERGCLGRLAKAAVLVERFFPETEFYAGEVLEDFFRNEVLKILHSTPNPPDALFSDILIYEEPHSVILIDGQQFDPISCVVERGGDHPRVKQCSLWEHVASSFLVSIANMISNPFKKLDTLKEAGKISPESPLVMENSLHPLVDTGNLAEAIKVLKVVTQERPTARSLFVL